MLIKTKGKPTYIAAQKQQNIENLNVQIASNKNF